MTARVAGASPARRSAPGRRARATGLTSMTALQRIAGNSSTLALLRRARTISEEPPIALTLPNVVDGAGVSSWSLHHDAHGRPTDVQLTRLSDADSPRLAQAFTRGAPAVTATMLVRKRTPLGSIRDLTVTMEDCTVGAFEVHGDTETIGLAFTRIEVEQ